MVQVVEVLPDPRFGALALDVGGGCSRRGAAGAEAAQSGRSSAGSRGGPEDQHGPGRSLNVPN